MLFNSFTFLIFFIVVFALFSALPGWVHKKYLLLLASYIFYAAWNPPYVFLLILSTTVDWWVVRLISREPHLVRRRILLGVCLISNLGMLSYFKYGSFFLENFAGLMAAVGMHYQVPESGIILPIGISFYVFASLSYVIDVYRKELRADWKFQDYALFVSFFPHLVAGPIVRASCLLPQIESPKMPSANQIGWGAAFVFMGLFCKVVMADAVFSPVVDEVFGSPDKHGMFDTWSAVFSFSGQIYYDFAGYSLCAIGLAQCFGFYFPENFRYPYAARGFSDFWRRWHISLSSWLRDYLYIPLGGNKSGVGTQRRNLMITMMLGGLWHGASWMFLLWGTLHGFFLVVEKIILSLPDRFFKWIPNQWPVPELCTFILVTLAWIPFRANELNQVFLMLSNLGNLSVAPTDLPRFLIADIGMILTLRWHFHLRNSSVESIVGKMTVTRQVGCVSACLASLFLSSGGDQHAFIYFQF